jgi:hypothetical protein
MSEDLGKIIEHVIDERVSEKLDLYERYLRSGCRDELTFRQYADRVDALDREYLIATNQYTND